MIETILLITTSVLVYFIVKVVFPPWSFPKNIPTIPFYVTFLGTFFDLDQEDIFELYLRKPMEKYGAVKIYFGSRWNILISQPELLAQIFKDEDTFAKSGNQKKIPYSVIAAYTGENVISAHGELWKLFRRTIMPGLQFFDYSPISKNAKSFCSLISDKLVVPIVPNELSVEKQLIHRKTGTIRMPELIQKLTLANITEVALGFNMGVLTDQNCELHLRLKNVKAHIFKSLYLNFPFLDKFPIPSRQRVRAEVEDFRRQLMDEVQRNMVENYNYEQTSFASSDLIRGFKKGELTRSQLVDNIVIILVAGHENPQLILTSCFYMLGKYKYNWQERLRREILQNKDMKLSELPLMNSFIYECIRMYPPLSQIINRLTSNICVLGRDIVIPKDTYVGYNVYGTGRLKSVWGPTANLFKPERWGTTINEIMSEWKHKKNSCAMSAFHGGRRVCLGEKLALAEVRITLAEMLKRFEWSLAPGWPEKMTSAGPLCPLNLQLEITELNESTS
ncbi:LAFE_0F15786g1_1 [Lachancea fermentati]|uniref:LAFE_0F15786g1_1 n=1 Tax=Lachancea fermentati TaxID=4955 RepID=A0A1G4MG15_LACFM|nr:LAFE_0F15786g1_1 [Lachancea fermentati]